MVGYVYVIEGQRGNKKIRYIGSTILDVYTRFAQHEDGTGAKTTRSMRDKKLIFYLKCNGTTCRSVEYYLKRHRKAMMFMIKKEANDKGYNEFRQWCKLKHINILQLHLVT